MLPFLKEFISANASAVFGLLGALGGGLLSFIASVILKRRDFKLQTWSKLLERQIQAHENVIALAIEMRVMIAVGGIDDESEVRRAPQVMMSKEEFEKWFTRFTQLTMEGTTWQSVETKREVNLAQDYLVTLHTFLANVDSSKYLQIGELIRQDFIDLSSSLEKMAFDYFENGIHKLRLDSLKKHHKYERKETEERLRETLLLKNYDKIQNVCGGTGAA